MLIRNLCEVHGMRYVILVPHNIIGPRQKYDDPYRNVASIMINRMLQGKQPIIYGDGSQKRCFSFVKDLIGPLMRACETEIVDGMTVNIGPDEEFISIKDLAFLLGSLLDFKVEPVYVQERPQEVKNANCSADLARKLLQYSTTTSLETGLIEMIAWIKQNGTRNFEYHLPIEIVKKNTPKTWTDKLI
jgi:UDP-glucose 4-epimerase